MARKAKPVWVTLDPATFRNPEPQTIRAGNPTSPVAKIGTSSPCTSQSSCSCSRVSNGEFAGMDVIAAFFGGQPQVLLWGLGGVLAALTLAVGITALLPMLKPGGDFTNLRQRIWSWWVMIALISGALLGGWKTVLAL